MPRELVGWVESIRRYPVKSMLGEDLDSSPISNAGLLGDRSFAVLDEATGKVASAKNPRKWGGLLGFRSSLLDPLGTDSGGRSVRIVLPDGSVTSSDRADVNERLSDALGTRVRLVTTSASNGGYEEYWPDIEGLAHRESVTVERMPPHTFFDAAAVHLLTTATLTRLGELHPDGRFDARRFRPNIVITSVPHAEGFGENDWGDRSLQVGGGTRLGVSGSCGRCVMTTLPQGDLASDLDVLRTAARHNRAKVGAYASVECEGSIRLGDPVWLD